MALATERNKYVQRMLNFMTSLAGRLTGHSPAASTRLEKIQNAARPMTGILPTLTAEQRERLLTQGSSAETFGDPARALKSSPSKP